MDIPTHEFLYEVMFFDTDCAGIIHNLAYLRMVEVARTALGSLVGLSPAKMQETQLFAVVLHTAIHYHKAAQLGDMLLVKGWLKSIHRARFFCAFSITKQSEESPLITCEQSLGLVKMPSAKPCRLPMQWKEQWPHLYV